VQSQAHTSCFLQLFQPRSSSLSFTSIKAAPKHPWQRQAQGFDMRPPDPTSRAWSSGSVGTLPVWLAQPGLEGMARAPGPSGRAFQPPDEREYDWRGHAAGGGAGPSQTYALASESPGDFQVVMPQIYPEDNTEELRLAQEQFANHPVDIGQWDADQVRLCERLSVLSLQTGAGSSSVSIGVTLTAFNKFLGPFKISLCCIEGR
jgi:hypothetical protein